MDLEFVKRQPVLENSPLKIVICQMRYPRQIGIGEPDVRPVQRALANDYPTARLGRAAELLVTPSGVVPTGNPEPVFQFLSPDAAWTVTVAHDALSLETTAYLDFTDFLKRWYSIVSIVTEAFDLTRQERIGLRYLNELPCPTPLTDGDLRRLVRPELVGVLGAHPRAHALISSSNELRFAQDRGVCTLRHGLIQRPEGDSVYVLDMDFYDDVAVPVDVDQQIRLLAEFSDGAFDVFRWSIEPKHFATFKPQETADA